MKKRIQTLLSMLLALAMIIGMFPAILAAEEATAAENESTATTEPIVETEPTTEPLVEAELVEEAPAEELPATQYETEAAEEPTPVASLDELLSLRDDNKLTANVKLTAELIIPEGNEVTIDLNGQTITAGGYTITNNGTLAIMDSSTGGKIAGTGVKLLINSGTLNIHSGSIEAVTESTATSSCIESSAGSITITGGTILASGPKVKTTDAYCYGVSITGGTLNITGGTITQQGSVKRENGVDKNGDPKYSYTGYGIYCGAATLNISQAENSETLIEGENRAIHTASASSKVTISGGTIKVRNADLTEDRVIYNTGTLTISGGTMCFGNKSTVGGNYGIYNDNAGKITMSGGKIDIAGTGNYLIGVYNRGSFKFTGGTIKVNGAHNEFVTAVGNKEHTGSKSVIAEIGGGTIELQNTKAGAKTATILLWEDVENGKGSTVKFTGGTISGPQPVGIYRKTTVAGTHTATLMISAGRFTDVGADALDKMVRMTENSAESEYSNLEQYKTSGVKATVTSKTKGNVIGYCSTLSNMTAAVNLFGANGQTVVEMHGDVAGTTAGSFNYGFTLNMNGHRLTTSTGNALNIKAGNMVVNGAADDGKRGYIATAATGSVTVAFWGNMTMTGVEVYSPKAAAVTCYALDGTGLEVSIENCVMISDGFYAYSNNNSSEQNNTSVTIKDCILVAPINYGIGGRNKGVNATFKLEGDVWIYQKAANTKINSNHVAPAENSAVATKMSGTYTYGEYTELGLFITGAHVAEIGNDKYPTIDDAIAAAEKEAPSDNKITIALSATATATNLTIPENVTLDLNGQTLQAAYINGISGQIVDNSEKGDGLLKAASVIFPKVNAQLPVWDTEAEGYRLITIKCVNKEPVWTEKDSFEYIFRFDLEQGKTVNNEMFLSQVMVGESQVITAGIEIYSDNDLLYHLEISDTLKADDLSYIHKIINNTKGGYRTLLTGAEKHAGGPLTVKTWITMYDNGTVNVTVYGAPVSYNYSGN